MTSAVAAGSTAIGDRAAGAPDEVGGVRADDLHPAAHADDPASRRVFVTAIVRTSSSLKPASRNRSAISGQPVLDRRVEDLPEVGGPDRRSGPDRADRLEHALPGAPCRCSGVVKQRSSSAPRVGEPRLILQAEMSWDGELGVGDDDRLDARLHGGVDHREDLVAVEVAGGEHHAVARDDVEHRAGLGQQRALLVDHRDGLDVQRPGRAAPAAGASTRAAWRRARSRGRRVISLSESTVGSHTVRAPSRAAISTASGFMPADGAVERDRAEAPRRPGRRR